MQNEKPLNLYIKLARAFNDVTAATQGHLQQENLTPSQFAVLEALYHIGPLNQGQLSRKILKSNANITTVVGSLEKKKLVMRHRPASDRRVAEVHLTADGRQLIARIFPLHADKIRQRMSVLSDRQQDQLATLLKKLGRG